MIRGYYRPVTVDISALPDFNALYEYPFAISIDKWGNLQVREQFGPTAEDNTNGVIAQVLKPLATNTYAPTLKSDFGANATLNVKAAPGNVLAVYGHNGNAAVRYFQIHNTITVPGGGATPIYSFEVPIGATLKVGNEFFVGSGGYLSTGIAYAWSTTLATYTAATAADHSTLVHYL